MNDKEIKTERTLIWHVWLILFWGIIFFLLIWDDMNKKEKQIQDLESEHCYTASVQMSDTFMNYPDGTLFCKNYNK